MPTTALLASNEIASTLSVVSPGDVVPDAFHDAVNSFDLSQEFTNDDWYNNQVDIYSDQLVAIEAIRLLVERLQTRVERAEDDIEENDDEIEINTGAITSNTWDTLQNTADIATLELDIADLEACLSRQEREQELHRNVLELYCHSHAYVEWIMEECIPVLVDETRLVYGFDLSSGYSNWTENPNVTPAVSQ